MIVLLIACIILIIIYISLIIYYRLAWDQIPVFQPSALNPEPSTFISVIIPARNESENLPALLKSLSEQTYPVHLFEVLIIDDHSTDNTSAIIHSFSSKNIQLINLKEFIAGDEINSYKKKAIEIGVEHSTGKLIVTTDADCYLQPKWLQTIAAFYEQYRPVFIAAPVSVNCCLRFIEIFQSLDFMTLQGITGASVHKKIHSMCNGANMAYEKNAFHEVSGYKGIDNIASGDDMLLMHKIYERYPERVMFLKSKDVIVQTTPVKSIREFFNQRIRWASKADKYDDKRIFLVLIIVYLINVFLLVLPIIAIIKNYQLSIINYQLSLGTLWVILLILKTSVELFFLLPVSKFFGKQRLLLFFPLMQPFHIVYTVLAGWMGKFGTYHWKDRNVK